MTNDEPGGERWDGPTQDGATPLDSDETVGLKLAWVATRADLNAAEQANIMKALTARRWLTMPTSKLLDDLTVRRLHRDMFGGVWAWAGKYRTSEKNIGVNPERVAVAVRDLVADAALWFTGDRPMPVDDAAVQFHHKLVAIHPFPNGNGRHSRAMTDLLLISRGVSPFTWGSASLDDSSDVRDEYIAALRAADGGNYRLLADFVRS